MSQHVVAVMGATGAGKSTFVKLVTESDEVEIGHGLTSKTEHIKSYPFTLIGYDILLVDTVGFDDTFRSDADVLQDLVEWLVTSYRAATKLCGIIYLHRITDVRMQGNALRNLRVFRQLCGEDFFKNVVLCTTFWDDDKHNSEYEARLNELTSNDGFWGGMIARGSRVVQGPLTRAKAIHAIYELVKRTDAAPLQVQREIVDQQRLIRETSALSTLFELELEQQRQEYEEKLAEQRRLAQEELDRHQRKLTDELESMRKEFEARLRAAECDASSEEKTAKQPDPQNQSDMIVHDQAPQTPVISGGSMPAPRPFVIKRKPTNPTRPVMPVESEVQPPRGNDKSEANATLATEVFLLGVLERQRRAEDFGRQVATIMKLLDDDVAFGRIKCDVLQAKSCYTLLCTNCMRNIGGYTLYKCAPCSEKADRPFILCQPCFMDDTIRCNDLAHFKADMMIGSSNAASSMCPRVRMPEIDAPSMCTKCQQSLGKVYLHCCLCQERFDMCIQCARQRRHCPGHRRGYPFQPHKLEVCVRYEED